MTILTIFQETNEFLEWISYPPASMLFIIMLATLTATISTLLTRWLVDTEEIERKQRQIKEHGELKEKVINLAEIDVERYRKQRKRWERKDTILKKTQQSIGFARMKPTCITFLPMIIIFSLLNAFFGRNPIACSPMNPWDVPFLSDYVMAATIKVEDWTAQVYGTPIKIETYHGWINFTAWYFLCSLGINTVIQRLLKVQTQASGGLEQMMGGGQKAKYKEFPDV